MANIPEYTKEVWRDHIVDNGFVVQQGTRFNQSRANNIEEGVEFNRNLLIEHERRMLKMQVQFDLLDRAPTNSGTFIDTLDGTNVQMDGFSAVINAPLEAGATTVTVDSANGLVAFTEVTIYDDVSREDVLITSINGNTLTVQSLQYAYKKGARVARSTVSIDTTNREMLTGAWTTYSVALVEVV